MSGFCVKTMLGIILVSAVAAAPVARAQVGHASEGYVYYHRGGATTADLHSALVTCVNSARDLRWIDPGIVDKKLAERIVENHFIVDGARRQLRANIENCIVANGWEVVRVDASEGARLSQLPQPDLEAALRPLIGATVVQGEIVRRFIPTTDYFNGHFYLGKDTSGTSLSVLADEDVSATVAHANTADGIYEDSIHTLLPSALLRVAAPESLTSTSTVIVVRAVAEERGGFDFLLARAEDDDKGVPKSLTLVQAYAHNPKRLFDKYGPDQTLIYVVPPGRWRLISTSFLSFCLGAPAFDVAEGKAVFAGTFRGKPGSALAPDMSLTQVKALLPPEVGNRLTPAAWRSDAAVSCAAKPQPYWYLDRLEFPSAPRLP
jgi:hypothetical protein